jgi:hypothetical protein
VKITDAIKIFRIVMDAVVIYVEVVVNIGAVKYIVMNVMHFLMMNDMAVKKLNNKLKEVKN